MQGELGDKYVLYLLEDQEEKPVAVILPKDAAEQPLPAVQEVLQLLIALPKAHAQCPCPSPQTYRHRLAIETSGGQSHCVLLADWPERPVWPGNHSHNPECKRRASSAARAARSEPQHCAVCAARDSDLSCSAGYSP